jgi:hypothetical protein
MLYRPSEQQRQATVPESAEGYPTIAKLNGRFRVIVCRDGIQWILQARHGPETGLKPVWDSQSYCRTSEALIRCCKAHAGAIDPAAVIELEYLPERIGGRR